ncbi:MAG: glycosyltransferase family 2 protein [Tahibacter sp.]
MPQFDAIVEQALIFESQGAAAELTSVIVVTADSGIGVLECVQSALNSDSRVEVIVSDNLSTDGSVAELRRRHTDDPRLRIVDNGKNLGFGAGVNVAAAQAKGDFLLVLNPDCVIQADLIPRLRAVLAELPGVGIVGVRIVDAAGKIEPAARRRDPTVWRSAMSLLGVDRWQRRWPTLAGVTLDDTQDSTKLDRVDAVSGAVMAMSRQTYARLAGFDEAYFLHCEDLDICRRARDLGLQVLYAGDISVVHSKGGSSRHRPVFVAWHKHRGMWRWFRRFDPAARNPALRALVWIGLWLHFGLGVPVRVWRGWRARNPRVQAGPSASD